MCSQSLTPCTWIPAENHVAVQQFSCYLLARNLPPGLLPCYQGPGRLLHAADAQPHAPARLCGLAQAEAGARAAAAAGGRAGGRSRGPRVAPAMLHAAAVERPCQGSSAQLLQFLLALPARALSTAPVGCCTVPQVVLYWQARPGLCALAGQSAPAQQAGSSEGAAAGSQAAKAAAGLAALRSARSPAPGDCHRAEERAQLGAEPAHVAGVLMHLRG